MCEGCSQSRSRPSCPGTRPFEQIGFPLNPEQPLSSPNCCAACGLLRGRQVAFCLPEARAVPAARCSCNFRAIPLGALRLARSCGRPVPSAWVPRGSCCCCLCRPPLGSHLCVIKLGSGSREEQLCLKLSLQNVRTDFIACTCRVWLLL